MGGVPLAVDALLLPLSGLAVSKRLGGTAAGAPLVAVLVDLVAEMPTPLAVELGEPLVGLDDPELRVDHADRHGEVVEEFFSDPAIRHAAVLVGAIWPMSLEISSRRTGRRQAT